ncbi:MAG: hypothetical protein RIC51_06575, partial [Erythrobacter sp.]
MKRADCLLALLAATAPLAACQTASQPEQARATVEPDPRGVVEAAWGGWHAVEPPFLSPNPQ